MAGALCLVAWPEKCEAILDVHAFVDQIPLRIGILELVPDDPAGSIRSLRDADQVMHGVALTVACDGENRVDLHGTLLRFTVFLNVLLTDNRSMRGLACLIETEFTRIASPWFG